MNRHNNCFLSLVWNVLLRYCSLLRCICAQVLELSNISLWYNQVCRQGRNIWSTLVFLMASGLSRSLIRTNGMESNDKTGTSRGNPWTSIIINRINVLNKYFGTFPKLYTRVLLTWKLMEVRVSKCRHVSKISLSIVIYRLRTGESVGFGSSVNELTVDWKCNEKIICLSL